MNDLFQFHPWGDFNFLIRITQRNESDDFNRFRYLKNFFHLWFIKGTDPASSEAKACGHRHHISACQSHIISSVFSLMGIETEDEKDGCFFHMGGFDEEESGYLSDSLSCLWICHHNEMPGLEIGASWSPSSCFKDLEEKILWNGFVLINTNRSSGF